jgi:hypothetical protein
MKVLEKTGLAVIGKVAMSTKERVVLIHYHRNNNCGDHPPISL